MIKDYAYFTTSKQEDFLSSLDEKEKNTKRYIAKGNEVRFRELEVPDFKTIDSETAIDTAENSGLVVEFPDNDDEDNQKLTVCLGSSAWLSIKGRIRIFGDGFDKLTNKTKTQVLNERFRSLNNDVTIIVSYNKVRAIMSDHYLATPARDIFENVFNASVNRLDDMTFINGNITHHLYDAMVSFPKKAEELQKVYNIPDNFIPGISIETSDTGYSASRIIPRWVTSKNKSMQMLSESIEVPHIGQGNDLTGLTEKLPTLFLKFNNTLTRLMDLMSISIDNPEETIYKVCESIKIPKKYAKLVAVDIDTNLPWTAYDIMMLLMGIPAMAENSNIESNLEIGIGKALWLNFFNL